MIPAAFCYGSLENMIAHCPCCDSRDTIRIEIISSKDIMNIYQSLINVERLFENIKYIGLWKCKKCALEYYFPRITGDDEFYSELQKLPWYYLEKKAEYDFAKKVIYPNNCVLEIGCGAGNFASAISPKQYVGLEFNKEALKKCHKKGLRVFDESIEKHATKWKRHYDVVSFQVLEHVEHVGSFIKSSVDVLTEGGKIIIAVPNNGGYYGKLMNAALNMPPHHVNLFDLGSIQKMANVHGLFVEDVWREKLSDLHTLAYKHNAIISFIRKLLFLKDKKIDLSLIHKAISYSSKLINMIINIDTSNAIGHTICVVLKKTPAKP